MYIFVSVGCDLYCSSEIVLLCDIIKRKYIYINKMQINYIYKIMKKQTKIMKRKIENWKNKKNACVRR